MSRADVEDIVRRAECAVVPRQRSSSPAEPVIAKTADSAGQIPPGQSPFSRLDGRAGHRANGEQAGQQVSLHDREAPDDRAVPSTTRGHAGQRRGPDCLPRRRSPARALRISPELARSSSSAAMKGAASPVTERACVAEASGWYGSPAPASPLAAIPGNRRAELLRALHDEPAAGAAVASRLVPAGE